ncbi:MAG: prolyl oligopeptidase family serine peptidase [Planctomycetes bacterium]|nr:prolyl oligopeptidase family serine peptidase [Planctomycetota bacterium]
MKTISNIAYAPAHGERGLGDLYLPDNAAKAPVALAIHGGGWNAMDKASWAGVAQFICEQGFAVFNINYRLLDIAPWPACGDDCLAAAEFLLAGGHEAMGPLNRKSGLVVIGGSAGGHLTLMTGLRLAKGKCRGMVSVAGPTDLHIKIAEGRREQLQHFFGKEAVTEQMLFEASPISYVKPWSPPLLCTHSIHDKLVGIEHSKRMIKFCHEVKARAELYAYPGPGEQHGIWIEGSDPHRLLPEIEQAIATFLKTV